MGVVSASVTADMQPPPPPPPSQQSKGHAEAEGWFIIAHYYLVGVPLNSLPLNYCFVDRYSLEAHSLSLQQTSTRLINIQTCLLIYSRLLLFIMSSTTTSEINTPMTPKLETKLTNKAASPPKVVDESRFACKLLAVLPPQQPLPSRVCSPTPYAKRVYGDYIAVSRLH